MVFCSHADRSARMDERAKAMPASSSAPVSAMYARYARNYYFRPKSVCILTYIHHDHWNMGTCTRACIYNIYIHACMHTFMPQLSSSAPVSAMCACYARTHASSQAETHTYTHTYEYSHIHTPTHIHLHSPTNTHTHTQTNTLTRAAHVCTKASTHTKADPLPSQVARLRKSYLAKVGVYGSGSPQQKPPQSV